MMVKFLGTAQGGRILRFSHERGAGECEIEFYISNFFCFKSSSWLLCLKINKKKITSFFLGKKKRNAEKLVSQTGFHKLYADNVWSETFAIEGVLSPILPITKGSIFPSYGIA